MASELKSRLSESAHNVRTNPAEKFLVSLFSKSAEPTGNQRTHIAKSKPSGTLYISQRAIKESFGPPFSKGGRFSGRRPEAHSAECETLPHRSKNAGEGEFLCEAKEEGEPSYGDLR